MERMTKNIGFGMGLEFREAVNLLNNKNERKVAAGMIFNVAVGMLAVPELQRQTASAALDWC